MSLLSPVACWVRALTRMTRKSGSQVDPPGPVAGHCWCLVAQHQLQSGNEACIRAVRATSSRPRSEDLLQSSKVRTLCMYVPCAARQQHGPRPAARLACGAAGGIRVARTGQSPRRHDGSCRPVKQAGRAPGLRVRIRTSCLPAGMRTGRIRRLAVPAGAAGAATPSDCGCRVVKGGIVTRSRD